MNLLDVPPEVIESSLFPCLGWNDLLHFRQVCQTTMKIVSDYIKFHSDLAPEIEISSLNPANESLDTCLKLGLSSVKLFFSDRSRCNRYSFYRWYDEKEMHTFLMKYGLLVKHLCVNQFFICDEKHETKFLNGLVHLESFETKHVIAYETYQRPVVISMAFQKLRVLKFGMCFNANEFPRILEALEECLKNCKMLERITIPFVVRRSVGATNLLAIFRLLYRVLKERSKILSLENSNLKVIDFANVNHIPHLPEPIQEEFLKLCYVCASNEIMLYNVHTKWAPDIRRYYPLCTELPVVSTIGVWNVDMPYLEKIEINSISQCCKILFSIRSKEYTRPNWPKLNSLSVNMFALNTIKIRDVDCIMESIIQFFFDGICRKNMQKLRLIFTVNFSMNCNDKMVNNLIQGCPHLKKLTLGNWPGTEELLIRLRKGLPDSKIVSVTTS